MSYFCMWSYRFPKTICWNDCPFPFKGCHSCWKSFDISMWVSLNLLLFSWSMFAIVPVSHCFETETLQLVLKLGKHETSNFVLFFNIIVYMGGGLLNFYMNFRMNLHLCFSHFMQVECVDLYNCSQYSSILISIKLLIPFLFLILLFELFLFLVSLANVLSILLI